MCWIFGHKLNPKDERDISGYKSELFSFKPTWICGWDGMKCLIKNFSKVNILVQWETFYDQQSTCIMEAEAESDEALMNYLHLGLV